MVFSQNQLKSIFLVSLLVLLLNSVLSLKSIDILTQDYQLVNETHLNLIEIENLFSNLKDLEPSARSYILSGDEVFLKSYKVHKSQLEKDYNLVSDLTKENYYQQKHLKALKRIIDTKILLVEKQMKDRTKVDIQSSLEIRHLTENARKIIDSMEQEQREHLEISHKEVDNSEKFINTLIFIGTVLDIILFTVLFFLMVIEIKKRIKTEQALVGKDIAIQKAKDLEVFADSLPLIIWSANDKGKLDYCNEKWYKYTGLTKEDSDENTWEQVLHPEDLENCKEAWNNSLISGKSFKNESRIKNLESGKYRWYLIQASQVRNAEGKTSKWYGSCIDIDDQKTEVEVES